MKSSFLVHGLWGAVCAASFVFGSQFFSQGGADASEAEKGARLSGQSVRVSTRSGAGSGGNGSSVGSRTGVRGERVRTMSDDDVLALAEDFKNGKGPIARRLAFSKLLENLTVDNAKLIREQLKHLPERSDEWREFHYAWGAIAGGEAVLHGQESKERDASSTLAGWASADPAAAIAWFNALPENQGGDLKWGAVYGLADAGPEVATNFAIERLAAGDKDVGRMMDVVARNLLRSGDPAEAARWSQNLPEGALQEAAVRRVAEEYADQDAPKAVSWLQSLPEGKAQERGLNRAFSEWAQDDPVAAAEQLNEMNPSPARDSAINGYVSRLAWEDPVAALEWADSVNDPASREGTLVQAGRAYFRKDREAAQQWLATSGLSEAAQKRVTRRRRGRR